MPTNALPRQSRSLALTLDVCAEPKKVLKPDIFQNFELQEKTVVSHNVAM